MAPDYRFVDADLLFYDKALEFITGHREDHPEQPFFVLLSTQIAHAPVLPAPGFDGATDATSDVPFVKLIGPDTHVHRVASARRSNSPPARSSVCSTLKSMRPPH